MKQKQSILIILIGLFWLSGTIGAAFVSKSAFQAKKDKNQTEISAYQIKAVVPAMALATVSPIYTLIFEVNFFINNSSNQFFQRPIFKLSFFEKVFEHLIAPKAP